MYVKWHGTEAKRIKLNGGGRPGGTLGIIEFLSQSNTNANCVKEYFRWMWVDDLTFARNHKSFEHLNIKLQHKIACSK